MASPNLDSLPSSLADHVGYLLVRLGKHAQRLFSAEVSALGLRPPHCDVLLVLEAEGARSQVEIAEQLMIERAHLVALLDQLQAQDLLARHPDPRDRRRHSVQLTDRGRQVATEVRAIAARVERALLADLPAADHAAFRAMLRRLAREADEGD